MKCHGDDKEKQSSHNHSPIKHMLHMVLCCGLPILIILTLPFVSKISPGIGGILGIIAPFICPIMMITMIPMMINNKQKTDCCDKTNVSADETLKISKPAE